MAILHGNVKFIGNLAPLFQAKFAACAFDVSVSVARNIHEEHVFLSSNAACTASNQIDTIIDTMTG